MNDVYLIKKETLTNIAGSIRNYIITEAGYDVPEAIPPEEMAGAIQVVGDSNYECGWSEGFDDGFDDGYDDGYNDGYNDGYENGYYNGVAETLNDNLNSGTVPLMIQGLMNYQKNDEGLFPPSMYTQDLCGTSYSLSSFIEEEVVTSSTNFTMSVINNTYCTVDLYCRAVCNTDAGYSEQEEFWLSVPEQSDGSYETTLGMGTQYQEWTYEILGVCFYYE